MTKIPERTDIVTRKSFPKEELLRFVVRDGKLHYDPSGKAAGRGFYLHPESRDKALDGKAFSRALRHHVSPEEAKEAIDASR